MNLEERMKIWGRTQEAVEEEQQEGDKPILFSSFSVECVATWIKYKPEASVKQQKLDSPVSETG
jgi:hypothetical protein